MYHPHDRRIDAATLARWRDYARRLGADKPTAASAMSNDLPTRALFGDDLAEVFQAPWQWVTIVSLGASQQIVAHRDQPLPPGVIRYHVPFQTNVDCWVYAPSNPATWSRLVMGQVYSMRPDLPHGAVNWGDAVRLHLLIDCPGLLPDPREPRLWKEDADGQDAG